MNPYDREKVWSDLRVGLITFAGLFFLILGITFAGGDKGLLFKKTTTLQAWLPDVGGLKKGSPVTMGGMTVGKVSQISFVGGAERNQIQVTMEVRSDLRDRIKTDSLPAVRTQGMLGDRYVDISLGTPSAKPLPEGEPLLGEGATDFDRALRQASEVLEETEKLLSAVNEQEGTVGQFFYDEKFYESVTAIIDELNDLIKDFKKHPKKYIKFSLF